MKQKRRAYVLSLTLASAALSASGPAGWVAESDGSVQVPFATGPRGHLIVEVSVDGGPVVPFALDTAAGRTVIHQQRLADLGLRPLTGADRSTVVQGAHGEHALGWTRLRSLALGKVAVGGMEVGTMDLSHVESGGMTLFGVLGADVLSRFDLELNLAGESATFHQPARSADDCAVCRGAVTVPFELLQGTHVQIELTIDAVPIAAILDTGSGRTGMNGVSAEALGIDLPHQAPGAHGVALQVSEVQLAGETLARDLVVGVVDLPVFSALGLAERPAMILGTGALAGRRIGISYSLGLLSIE